MYIIRPFADQHFRDFIHVKKGEDYLMDSTAMTAFVNQRRTHIVTVDKESDTYDPLNISKGIRDIPFAPAPRILFTRPGGWGDVLFLTPVFREIKRIIPDAHVGLCSYPVMRAAIEGNMDVDEFVDYPMKLEDVRKWNSLVWVEEMVEFNRRAEKMHIVDLGLELAGIKWKNKEIDKRIEFNLLDHEVEWAAKRFPRGPKKRLGVQVFANANCRTYPPEMTDQVINLILESEDWEIFFFGEPDKLHMPSIPDTVNLTQHRPPLGFRHSAALIATCDVFLGPDSALTHVAGAMNIPTVALYGPFPWRLRTKYAPSIKALQMNADCSPCFFHKRGDSDYPANGPCSTTGRCEVLGMIQPDRIVTAINQQYSSLSVT